MSKLNTRAKVIATLEKIQQGQSLASLLDPLLQDVGDKDKGFAHELLLGTLRQWWALSRIGESLIEKEVTDKGVWAGLNVGLYQLLYMDTPDYASINDTVEAVKQLEKGYGAGLINAILRKVQKNPAKFAKKIAKNHSLPNWLAKELKQDWAGDSENWYDDLGQALRQSAPIFLRINAKFTTLDDYTTLLKNQDIGFELVNIGVKNEQTILLNDNVKIGDLPHFADGWVSVQDRHAQISAHLLASLAFDKPLNVLDACTAPGGKLAHLLELSQKNMFHVEQFNIDKITALDNDKKRLERVSQNLERLQLSADNVSLVCDDATTFTALPFDVIVLDAPCTATGVIRRHPDIALLRTQNDVMQTVDLQAKILANCWQNLAKNGVLLYVTCSVLKAENETQIGSFLAKNDDAKVIDFTLNLPNQIKRDVGYQCLPLNENDGDGFYYALLQKV